LSSARKTFSPFDLERFGGWHFPHLLPGKIASLASCPRLGFFVLAAVFFRSGATQPPYNGNAL
jgi:hypothetical protein